MKVQRISGVKCPHCEEVITNEDDVPMVYVASDGKVTDNLGRAKKGGVEAVAVGTLYRCGECEIVYDNRTDAAACCA